MLSFDGNTAPYLQYAHARICSIFRRAGVDRGGRPRTSRRRSTEPQERALALRMLGFDAAVWSRPSTRYSPHKLCTYLFDLAQDFTAFYEDCPVLQAPTSAIRRAGWRSPTSPPAPSSRARPARHRRPGADVSGRALPLVAAARHRRRRAPTDRSSIGGCSVAELAARARHAVVRLRRAAPPQPLPRGGRRVRRRPRRLRHEGVPLQGDGPARLRGGDAARRGQRGRAARRARRRRAGGPAACCTATTRASTSCAMAMRGRRAPHRRRLLRRARPPRRARTPRASRRARVSCCGSRPGVHAHTHEFIATGQDDSKFGFNLGNGDADGAVERAHDSRACDLVGLHCHIGSNVFAASSFAKAAEVMAEFAVPLDLPELVLGGGLGVAVRRRRGGADDHAVGQACCSMPCRRSGVDARGQRRAGPGDRRRRRDHRLHGRHVKRIPGVRTYVAVDGGMSDNPRPVLYGSGYEAFLPRAPSPTDDLDGAARRQALRERRRADLRRPRARRSGRRRPARHAGHRRLRPLDGLATTT